MEPSCHQNPSKLGHGFDNCFLKDVGSISIDFLFQHNTAYIAKTLKKFWFLWGSGDFGIILVLCFWDDFLLDFS